MTDVNSSEATAWSADMRLRSKIEHELDEMMLGVENYFGHENPKRRGHIHCALERIMALIATPAQ